MFKATPYRLVATATPAPNDLIELGRYSQFLGIMDSGEMLTRYFIRDSQSPQPCACATGPMPGRFGIG
jgi:hypothetical protein